MKADLPGARSALRSFNCQTSRNATENNRVRTNFRARSALIHPNSNFHVAESMLEQYDVGFIPAFEWNTLLYRVGMTYSTGTDVPGKAIQYSLQP